VEDMDNPNEMVERVARAICDAEGKPWGVFDEAAIRLARVAIAVMREPTEAMVEIGRDARWRSPIRDGNSAREIWRAMIDASLKD